MKLTDELKILDGKIKANRAHYNLDSEAAKISALSSKELDQYEYFIGDDLALKPGTHEIKWAEYSSLAPIVTKAIKEMMKSKRLLNMAMI